MNVFIIIINNRFTKVDFIGIFEADPVIAADGSSVCTALDETFEEAQTRNPPTSLIPRLHCLLHRPVSPADEVSYFASEGAAMDAWTDSGLEMGRSSVVAHLAAALGGDELAAEYSLLTISGARLQNKQAPLSAKTPKCVGGQ